MPPEIRDLFDRVNGNRAATGLAFFLMRVIGFMFMLFVGAIFSTIGGLLGSVVFVRKLPPGTIDVTSS
jgi:hypothetical protein